MQKIFVEILNLSIVSAWLILVVLGLRALIKKIAPRWTICLLWALVAVCLVVPFSFESDLSLVPSRKTIVLVDKEEIEQPADSENAIPENPSINEQTPPSGVHINSGFIALDNRLNAILESFTQSEEIAENTAPEKNNGAMILRIASYIWLAGTMLILGYFAVNYIMLKARLKGAIEYEKNVYLSDKIDSPFLFGFIKPKIYLPLDVSDEAESYVLAHERAHIKRFDYIIKPFGFVLLAIHWFNPFVWIAYTMLGRDIEYACDEKVIKDFGNEERKAYATALLECGVKAVGITCPVAFGEISVKSRILKTLNYKKPMLWVILFIVFATAILALCFLSSPKQLVIVNDEANVSIEEKPAIQNKDAVLGVWYTNGHSLMFEDGGDGVCHSNGMLIPFKWKTDSDTINLSLAEEYKSAVTLPTQTEFALSEDLGALTIGNTVYTSTYQSKMPENIDSTLVGAWYSYSTFLGENTMIFNADGSGRTGGEIFSIFTWSVKDNTLYVKTALEGVSYTTKYKDYIIDGDKLTLKQSGIKKTYSKNKLELGGNKLLIGTWNLVTDSEEKPSLTFEANGCGEYDYNYFLWKENDGSISFYSSEGINTAVEDFNISKAEYTVNDDRLTIIQDGKTYDFTLEPDSRPLDVGKSDINHPLGGDAAVVGKWSVKFADNPTTFLKATKIDISLNNDGTGTLQYVGVNVPVNWYTDENSKSLAIYFATGGIPEDVFYGEYHVKDDTLYVNDGSVVCFARSGSDAVSHIFMLESCSTFVDLINSNNEELYLEESGIEGLIILRTTTDISDLKVTRGGVTKVEYDKITVDRPFGAAIDTKEDAPEKKIYFTDANGNNISFTIGYTVANGINVYNIEKLTIN